MMMPANFSAVAENEMTYVVGGSLVDVLAPAMTTANWQNVSANVGDLIGQGQHNKGYGTFENNAWGLAVGALNAGMQILGGLSAIYTLGSSSIGLEFKGTDALTVPTPATRA